MNAKSLWRVSGALPLLLALGCSGSGGMTKVNGEVTLDGKPLSNAMVSFIPEEGTGIQATGVTGSDGSFRLTTYSTGDGAKPGMYKVTVSVSDTKVDSGTQPPAPGDAKAMADAMKKFQDQSRKREKPKAGSTVPTNYTDAKKTPLKQKVPPDGKVVLELRSTGS